MPTPPDMSPTSSMPAFGRSPGEGAIARSPPSKSSKASSPLTPGDPATAEALAGRYSALAEFGAARRGAHPSPRPRARATARASQSPLRRAGAERRSGRRSGTRRAKRTGGRPRSKRDLACVPTTSPPMRASCSRARRGFSRATSELETALALAPQHAGALALVADLTSAGRTGRGLDSSTRCWRRRPTRRTSSIAVSSCSGGPFWPSGPATRRRRFSVSRAGDLIRSTPTHAGRSRSSPAFVAISAPPRSGWKRCCGCFPRAPSATSRMSASASGPSTRRWANGRSPALPSSSCWRTIPAGPLPWRF